SGCARGSRSSGCAVRSGSRTPAGRCSAPSAARRSTTRCASPRKSSRSDRTPTGDPNMLDRELFLPFPEIVDAGAGAYRIRDSSGRTTLGSVDRLHRRLWIPLRGDGRPVVRHELAHIRWSPPSFPEVEFPIAVLHAVEDARINLGLADLGVPVRLDAEQR